MKAYILTQADIDQLSDLISNLYVTLATNGDAERHRQQAREQYQEIVNRWIEGATK